MIIIDKGENVGNTIKLVSGFILFVIGVLIAYESTVYNLIDLLLLVGFIISIVGIILIISYFVDSNADRTTNKIKEFLESREGSGRSFVSFDRESSKKNSNGPLKIRDDYNDYDDSEYDEIVVEDFVGSSDGSYFRDTADAESKAVLNVVPQQESEVNFDNQLEFTPHYGKPLKVTRAPKKRRDGVFTSDSPEFVTEQPDKSDEIRRALAEEPIEPIKEAPIPVAPEIAPEPVPSREIKIDVNNPESLPIPKSLNSYVISDTGVLTSREAFDNLAINVTKEIMLEIPSLNDLSDRFLSHVPTIYSRVIIDEFDVSDMSYMFLISSLLKQGVHIKTVPKVHSTNLITDDSYAMIISEGANDMEYGAIYNDRNSISNIRADFERTWNIASNLDETVIMSAANGV